MSDREVILKLSANLNDFNTSMKQVSKKLSSIERNTKQTADTLSQTFRKVGMMIKGALAFEVIKDFTVGMVKSTSEIKALESQYEQVMAGMQGSADEHIGNISKLYNKHPNDLKGAMLQYQALLKGKGVSEEKAFELSKSMLDRTVDANAFANEDMASTVERFVASIKGEYDSLDTAMVDLSAKRLDDASVRDYGMAFNDLTVAQQESLKVAEMYAQHDLAGVLGQGEREADSFESQLQMLKGSWKELMGNLGDNVLPVLADNFGKLAEKLRNLDVEAMADGFKRFGTFIAKTLIPALKTVVDKVVAIGQAFLDSSAGDVFKTLLEGIKDALLWMLDNIDPITEVVIAMVAGFVAFKAVLGIAGAIKAVSAGLALLRSGSMLASIQVWVLNASMLANPAIIIAGFIAVLIAVVVWLWQNWETIGPKMKAMWDSLKAKASEVWGAIGDKIQEIEDKVNAYIQQKWEALVAWLSGIWESVKTAYTESWTNMKNKVIEIASAIWEFLKEWGLIILIAVVAPVMLITALVIKYWDEIKAFTIKWGTILKDVINTKFTQIKKAVTDKVAQVKQTISDKFSEAKRIVVEKVTGIWSSIKEKFGQIVSTISSKLQEAVQWAKDKVTEMKSAFTSIDWMQLGKDIVQGIINGIVNMGGMLKEKLKGLANSALEAAKSALNVNSPSKKFRDQVGKPISEGIAVGIEEDAPMVDDSLKGTLNRSLKLGSNYVAHNSVGNKASSGSGSVSNNFNISQLVVREEADVKKLAIELAREQNKFKRAGGRVVYGT